MHKLYNVATVSYQTGNGVSMLTAHRKLFPYIAEPLIKEMLDAEKNKQSVLDKFGLATTSTVELFLQTKLSFSSCDVRFDGYQNVDVGLLATVLGKEIFIPLEVKAGRERLSLKDLKALADAPCSISDHRNQTRIKGNMIAVLEGNYDEKVLIAGATRDTLQAILADGKKVPLSKHWGLIAFKSIVNKLEESNFQFAKLLEIEKIIQNYGGKSAFQLLCSDIFADDDFYTTWIESDVQKSC